MVNRVLLATIVAYALFLLSGAIELGFCLVVRGQRTDQPTSGTQATRDLLYDRFPLTAGIVNASAILVTFVFMLPGLVTSSRGWLKLSGVLVVFCAIFSLCVGTFLWIMSLQLENTFAKTYVLQEPAVQGLVQTSFGCCGFYNSTSPAFVTDTTCPSPAAAALRRGCAPFVSSFAGSLLNDIFTAIFGMVGVDALFVLCITCLVNNLKERERYRYIDEKNGVNRL